MVFFIAMVTVLIFNILLAVTKWCRTGEDQITNIMGWLTSIIWFSMWFFK